MTENHEKSKNGDEIEIFKKNRKSLKKEGPDFHPGLPYRFQKKLVLHEFH